MRHFALTIAALLGSVTVSACGGDELTSPGESAAPVATQLAFGVQPTDVQAGAAIAPAVEVMIQVAAGNTLTTATDAVTVELRMNPSGATVAGATTVNAVAGVASFDSLVIDNAGSGYMLVATSGNLTSATSAAFTVSRSRQP